MPAFSRRAFVAATLLVATVSAMYSQRGPYGAARGLVYRVQNDLRRAERFTRPNDKEKERYFNAQHHLSSLTGS